MITLYSNTRYEIVETTSGHVFVTDHESSDKKTEAANTAQGNTLRQMIAEIVEENEPDDATALVEFLEDECYRIVYRDQMIHDKITRELVGRSGVSSANLIVSIVR